MSQRLKRSARGATYGGGIDTEEEKEDEVGETGLVVVVEVAATNEAERSVLILSDGRAGSAVGLIIIRLGTEVGKIASSSIGFSV